MQKTADLIEGVIRHLNKLLADPNTPPQVRESAEALLERLRSDLQMARAAANHK